MVIAALMHCDLFKIYCAPPNLGITRTWICQLNFAWDLRLRTPSLKSLLEDWCSGFLHPEKIHRPQPDLNLQALNLEVSTLPWDHQGQLLTVLIYFLRGLNLSCQLFTFALILSNYNIWLFVFIYKLLPVGYLFYFISILSHWQIIRTLNCLLCEIGIPIFLIFTILDFEY